PYKSCANLHAGGAGPDGGESDLAHRPRQPSDGGAYNFAPPFRSAPRPAICRGPGPPAHREDVYFRIVDFFGGADFFRLVGSARRRLDAAYTALVQIAERSKHCLLLGPSLTGITVQLGFAVQPVAENQ